MLFLQLSPFGSNISAAMNNEGILLCCGRVDMWMYRVWVNLPVSFTMKVNHALTDASNVHNAHTHTHTSVVGTDLLNRV